LFISSPWDRLIDSAGQPELIAVTGSTPHCFYASSVLILVKTYSPKGLPVDREGFCGFPHKRKVALAPADGMGFIVSSGIKCLGLWPATGCSFFDFYFKEESPTPRCSWQQAL
jgi:hypothetical protein